MTTLDTQTKEAIKITKEAIKNGIADQQNLPIKITKRPMLTHIRR